MNLSCIIPYSINNHHRLNVVLYIVLDTGSLLVLCVLHDNKGSIECGL